MTITSCLCRPEDTIVESAGGVEWIKYAVFPCRRYQSALGCDHMFSFLFLLALGEGHLDHSDVGQFNFLRSMSVFRNLRKQPPHFVVSKLPMIEAHFSNWMGWPS